MSLNSLKPILLDVFCFSQIEKYPVDGLIGLLLGNVFDGKIYILDCIPLKCELTEQFLIEANNLEIELENLKQFLKQMKYAFPAGISFCGFYIKCNYINQTIIENKLGYGIWQFLKEKMEDLVLVFEFNDKKTIYSFILNKNMKNSEKISFKYQNIIENFVSIEVLFQNQMVFFVNSELYKLDTELFEYKKFFEQSILEIEGIIISNEKEPIESIIGLKKDSQNFEMKLYCKEYQNDFFIKGINDSLCLTKNYKLKVLINKKSNFEDLKNLLFEDFQRNINGRLLHLSKIENIEKINKELYKTKCFLSLPYRSVINIKKKLIEIYNYKSFLDFFNENNSKHKIFEIFIDEKNIINQSQAEIENFPELEVKIKTILQTIKNIDEDSKIEMKQKSEEINLIKLRDSKIKKEENLINYKTLEEKNKQNIENNTKQYLILFGIITSLIIIRILAGLTNN